MVPPPEDPVCEPNRVATLAATGRTQAGPDQPIRATSLGDQPATLPAEIRLFEHTFPYTARASPRVSAPARPEGPLPDSAPASGVRCG